MELSFYTACLLMGLGIGADVLLATLTRSQHLSLVSAASFWIVGVTATHTLFPALGYAMTYYSVSTLPVVTPIIGLVAFALIAHFLVSEWLQQETESHSQHLVTLGLILAVSWDALWSGPAKSAQVSDWSPLAVIASFFVVGFVVNVCAFIGLLAGRKMNGSLPNEYQAFVLWLQYSVIGYFAWLALCSYTLEWQVSTVSLLLFSAIFTWIMMRVLPAWQAWFTPRTNDV